MEEQEAGSLVFGYQLRSVPLPNPWKELQPLIFGFVAPHVIDLEGGMFDAKLPV